MRDGLDMGKLREESGWVSIVSSITLKNIYSVSDRLPTIICLITCKS